MSEALKVGDDVLVRGKITSRDVRGFCIRIPAQNGIDVECWVQFSDALAAKREAPAGELRHERLKSRLMGIMDGADSVYGEVWEKWLELDCDKVLFTQWLGEIVEKGGFSDAQPAAPAGRETQNDTVEYWRTRAITAETKVLEFSAQLEKLGAGRETQLRVTDVLHALMDMTNGVIWKKPEADGHIERLTQRLNETLAADKPQPPAGEKP